MILNNVSQLSFIRRTLSGVVVATNGCFDILHVGHVRCLEAAKKLGDFLVVGLNSDVSVAKLKGPTRPLNSQAHRAEVLAALKCVDAVCIFDGVRCNDFLEVANPHVYVKGGDYSPDSLDAEEKSALGNARIVFVPITEGCSTTNLIRKINEQR